MTSQIFNLLYVKFENSKMKEGTKQKQTLDLENKLVAASGGKAWTRSKIGVGN